MEGRAKALSFLVGYIDVPSHPVKVSFYYTVNRNQKMKVNSVEYPLPPIISDKEMV
jgi:hypothetical protein